MKSNQNENPIALANWIWVASLNLEEGSFYQNGRGEVIGPISPNTEEWKGTHPWTDPKRTKYRNNGTTALYADERTNYDLIKEVDPAAPVSEPTSDPCESEAKPEAEQIFTCPASRHVAMMAEELASDGKYIMLNEDPKHCAGSLRATVDALWKAREELSQANASVGRLTSILESIRDYEDAPSSDLLGDERLGVHCGVEDRGCSDRYEGADYGYGQGIERGLEWASNLASSALEGTPPAPDGWRGMETAPKDGTWFLVFDLDNGTPADFYVMTWEEPRNTFIDNCGDAMSFTHWMSLPKPPTGKGEA